MDLLGKYPNAFIVTDDVHEEITSSKHSKHKKQMEHHTKQMEPHPERVEYHKKQMEYYTEQMEPHPERVEYHKKQMKYNTEQMEYHKKKMEYHTERMEHYTEQMRSHPEKAKRHRKNTDRYQIALAEGHLFQTCLANEEINIQGEISEGTYITLRAARVHGEVLKKSLGLGERSIIALALNRNYTSLATDDQGAIKFVETINDIFSTASNGDPSKVREKINTLETHQIMVKLIQLETLTVDEADTILRKWQEMPSCQLDTLIDLTSFRDLL